MSSILVGAQGLVVLLAVILLNVPIAAAMALVGVIGTLVLDANAAVFSLFGTATVQALSSQNLIVIPLFILLGGFAIVAGLSTEIYRLAHVWFGHLRGGLATTATMVQVALPEMRRRGYSDALIAGSIAGGGTLGSLIPPSVIMVVYAILTQQSVLDLFRAAIVPGIVAVLLYFAAIRLFMLWNPGDGQALPRASWRERAQATGQARLRDTLAGAIPPDIERKVRRNAVLERDDYIRWQDVLARRIWRPRLFTDAPLSVRTGLRRDLCPAAGIFRRHHGRADHLYLWQCRAKGAFPARYPGKPRLAVSGLFRAAGRLGPGRAAHLGQPFALCPARDPAGCRAGLGVCGVDGLAGRRQRRGSLRFRPWAGRPDTDRRKSGRRTFAAGLARCGALR